MQLGSWGESSGLGRAGAPGPGAYCGRLLPEEMDSLTLEGSETGAPEAQASHSIPGTSWHCFHSEAF